VLVRPSNGVNSSWHRLSHDWRRAVAVLRPPDVVSCRRIPVRRPVLRQLRLFPAGPAELSRPI